MGKKTDKGELKLAPSMDCGPPQKKKEPLREVRKKTDKGELKLAPSMDCGPPQKKKSLLRDVGEFSLAIIGFGCVGVLIVARVAGAVAGPLCRALLHEAGERSFGDSDSGSSGSSSSDRGYGDSVWTGSSGSGKKPGSWSSGRHR